MASTDPPAKRPTGPAPALQFSQAVSDLTLEHRFPYPIAAGYRALKVADRPLPRLLSLCSLASTTTQFLGIVVLQDVLSRASADGQETPASRRRAVSRPRVRRQLSPRS